MTNSEEKSVLLKMAEAHETLAECYRELIEMGIQVPKQAVKVDLGNMDKETEKPEEKRQITFTEVRQVLAAKSSAGHRLEVQEIIRRYGANKLSEIPEDKYEDVLKEAGELDG